MLCPDLSQQDLNHHTEMSASVKQTIINLSADCTKHKGKQMASDSNETRITQLEQRVVQLEQTVEALQKLGDKLDAESILEELEQRRYENCHHAPERGANGIGWTCRLCGTEL